VYFGSQDNNMYAVSASTGALLWSSAPGGQLQSSPAVANGIVYIGSVNGNVYALRATTGAKLWNYTTGGEVSSSPAVVSGVVYVGSWDHNVYALNASTGAKLWSFHTGDLVSSSPAVVNGVVYFGSYDDNVYALNAGTGAKLWSFAAGIPVFSSPAVANGVVFIEDVDGNMYALNAGTGAKLWSRQIGNTGEDAPAVANGVVYVDAESVYALNANTGAVLWNANMLARDTYSSPAVANGVVYIGSKNDGGIMYALNAATGATLWSYTTGTFGGSSLAVVDGVTYGSSENHIYAFSLVRAANADLFLRVQPSSTTVHQGDLLTYAFPVWNLGPGDAVHEVLNTQVPAGTTFDYIRISGTPGLSTCTTPPYQGTGQIVCHENASMAANTTWTVRLTVRVTAPSSTVITENAATLANTPDPNPANNTATVSVMVQ
jgi:outer membrane protein assembly factor BamB